MRHSGMGCENWVIRTSPSSWSVARGGGGQEVRVCEAADARAPLVAGQPEVRRHRGRYIVNDEPVGNYSAVVSGTPSMMSETISATEMV